MTVPDCSIIIRAYNEEKHIGRLLEGIQQQTVQNVEVLLVDSGSTDATVSIAQQYPVKVIHIRPEDFTFGRSLNRGIEAAQAELCVFASAHVYPVYPDWLEKLLAPLEVPQVGLSYGKQRGNAFSKFSEKQILAHWFPEQSTLRQTHPFSNNANAAIRRSLWQTHPYDETLPGLEDLAWARWAFEQGWAVAYSAEAEIIHVHQETPKGVYNRYRREGMAFKQIYPHEHFRLGDFARLFVSNAASDWSAARRQGVLAESWRSILWFRWMQFWGTFRGYRQSGPLTWQLKEAFYYPTMMAAPAPEKSQREVPPIQYT